MAQSRLEKVGTIYSRTRGLIETGALRWEDRPLWYDVFEAFPPKEEPRFDRPVSNTPLRKIFYEEDKYRAIFHRNNKRVATNLLDNKYKSLTQKFIETYKHLEAQYAGTATEKQMYLDAIDLIKKDKMSKKDDEDVSLSTIFKEAQEQKDASLNVKIRDLFKN